MSTDLIPAAIATVKDANAVTLDLDTTVKSSNVAVNTLTADAVKFGKTLDATNAIMAGDVKKAAALLRVVAALAIRAARLAEGAP